MIRDEILPTFRVFVSSTFDDFKVERDTLREHAFRELEAYCEQRGCSFQAVDLRWGIDAEASVQQRTMRTCLDELKLCQSLSPRPNFLVLLGDRTGWLPLPEEIPGREMEQLLPHLPASWRDRVLDGDGRDGLYRLDRNSLAPGGLYELVPRTGVYAEHRTRWTDEVEQPLRLALIEAATAAGFSDTQLARYRASATEQEILAGAFAPESADKHVVFFERVIAGAGPSPNETMKARLRTRLGARAKRYPVPAAPTSIDDPAMLSLSEAVATELRAIIDAEIERRRLQDRASAVAAAWRGEIARRRGPLPGREIVCEAVVQRCLEAKGTVQVIEGAPGMGKTACVARCAALVAAEVEDALIVGCLCGTRPELFDCAGVFTSLQEQALAALGTPSAVAESRGLRAALKLLDMLKFPARKRPVYLFIDGLDVLEPDPAAAHLPQVLLEFARQRIHVVVGVRTGDTESRLAGAVGPDHVTRLGPLDQPTASTLLAAWLAEDQRCLTPEQTELVLRGHAEAGSPFWLRLAAGVARAWPHDRALTPLPGTVEGLLHRQVEMLSAELGHGPLLVGRTLEALAAVRQGLPEPDLVAFLSSNAQVMDEFRLRHPDSPPSGTLPPIVWTRLRRDLEPLLGRRFVWSSLVLHLAYSQVRDALRSDLARTGRLVECQAQLVSWLTAHRPAAPWAMAERDDLLAELGRDDELATALGDLGHLERRCRARQVRAVIPALHRLAGRYPSAAEWHRRLSRHVGDLASGHLSLATIASIETPQALMSIRARGAEGELPADYLEVQPVWSAQLVADGPVVECELTSAVDGPVFVFATSDNPLAFFRFLGHGIIERTSIDQAGAASIAIENGPPARLAASSDGAHLGIIWQGGSGAVVAADSGGSQAPTVHRFTVRQPHAELPAMCWLGERLFWQGSDGSLRSFDRTSAREHARPMPPGWERAEIGDVAGGATNVKAVLRQDGDCAIGRWAGDAAGAIVARFDQQFPVAFAAMGEQASVIALASHRVVIIDEQGETTGEAAVDLLPMKFVVAGGQVCWLSDGGHLWTWTPGSAPEEILPYTEVIDVVALGDGRLAIQRHTEVEVVRLGRRRRPLTTSARLHLFAQAGLEGAYCGFRTVSDDHGRVTGLEYLEATSRLVLSAFNFKSVTVMTAGSGHAIACLNEGGWGFVYETRNHGTIPVTGIPEVARLASVAGIDALDPDFREPAPGFVAACLDGTLHWLQMNGKARPIGRLSFDGISRAALLRRGGLLLWHGIYLLQGDEGMSDTYGLCLFDIHPDERRLAARGSRQFALSDGKLNAAVFDDVTGEIVLFWSGHATLGSYVMRAQPDDLVKGREDRRPLPFDAQAAAGAGALPRTRLCVLDEPGGTARLFDLEHLRILCALPGGLAAQSLTPAGPGAFLFADQGGGVHLATRHTPGSAS